MKYFLVKTVIDDAGNLIAQLEDREMPADEVIAALVARGSVAAQVPVKEKKAGKVKTGKKSKRTVTCKGCGDTGHLQKTCPNKNSLTQTTTTLHPVEVDFLEGPDEKSIEIRRMLLDGFSDADVAEECGVKDRVVAFIRKGMISRGELSR